MAFERYLIKRYPGSVSVVQSNLYQDNPDFANKFAFVSVTEAAKLLGCTVEMVTSLAIDGRLTICKKVGRFTFVRRSEVLALQRRWHMAVPLLEVANQLGVSEAVTLDLISLGLLEAERGPGCDGYSKWLLKKNVLDKFLEQIAFLTKKDTLPAGNKVDLTTVAKMVANVGLNSADVLKLVIGGKLTGYGHDTCPGQLFFSKAEAHACSKAIVQKKGWVRRETIARRMGVKLTVVTGWGRNGLLTPAATHCNTYHFDKKDIDTFIRDHIFTSEAAKILGVGVLTVQKWARDGRLQPVSGPNVDGLHRYLFNRSEVVKLSPKNRMTAPEMARKLGISRSQLSVYIKSRKVRPISGPGIDNTKHYLFLDC